MLLMGDNHPFNPPLHEYLSKFHIEPPFTLLVAAVNVLIVRPLGMCMYMVVVVVVVGMLSTLVHFL